MFWSTVCPTVLPYTPLFRSDLLLLCVAELGQAGDAGSGGDDRDAKRAVDDDVLQAGMAVEDISDIVTGLKSQNNIHVRSEEHTSELQSPSNIVCRLLLEKKK